MNTSLQAKLNKPRCDNPFDDDYLWYLAVKDKRDPVTKKFLTSTQKKELRNKAILFLGRHAFSRNDIGYLFDIGPTMVSYIVRESQEKSPFVNKWYKMTQEKADELRQNYDLGYTQEELSNMYNISRAVVSQIVNHKTWNKENEKEKEIMY